MQGPSREKEESEGFSQYLVCVSPVTNAEPFEIHPSPKTNEGNPAAGPGPAADTQHRPLQARRCRFMSALPSMNLRIFPNISPAPYPPVRLKSEPRIPPIRSHRFHYSSPRPLLSTRAATEPKKKWPPPTLVPSPFLLPSCSSKAKPCQNPFVTLIEDCHVNCVHRHSCYYLKFCLLTPRNTRSLPVQHFVRKKIQYWGT